MADFINACRFVPTTGGTTDWTFSSAVTGYQSPSAAGVVNGHTYHYRAESPDLTLWELGEGTYNTGTGVLTRTTIFSNSSGGTSKINFTGSVQVAIVALAQDLPLGKPYFAAYSASNQTPSLATLTKINYDTDLGLTGATAIDTTNHRITPTKAGVYLVIAGGLLGATSPANPLFLIRLKKNGTTDVGQATLQADSGTALQGVNPIAIALISFNGAGDFVEAYAFINSGTSPQIIGNILNTTIQAFYVGPTV